MLRTIGCVRLVYNKALEARTAAWYQEQRRVNYVETSAMLTTWKKTDDLAFLNEVSSVPLQQCLRHLQSAFTSFFDKRTRYPRFKSLLTLFTGEKITNPRHERRDRARLAKAQRDLARMDLPMWGGP